MLSAPSGLGSGPFVKRKALTVCPTDVFSFCGGCRNGVCDQVKDAVLPEGSEQAGLVCVQADTSVLVVGSCGLALLVDMDTSLLKVQS